MNSPLQSGLCAACQKQGTRSLPCHDSHEQPAEGSAWSAAGACFSKVEIPARLTPASGFHGHQTSHLNFLKLTSRCASACSGVRVRVCMSHPLPFQSLCSRLVCDQTQNHLSRPTPHVLFFICPRPHFQKNANPAWHPLSVAPAFWWGFHLAPSSVFNLESRLALCSLDLCPPHVLLPPNCRS